jgi:plastocyanin
LRAIVDAILDPRKEFAMVSRVFPILLVGVVAGGIPRTTAHPSTATVAPVEVRMTGNGTSTGAFVPNTVTIKAGGTIRFINASGGPHNVTFYPDSIPAGAAAALKTGMPTPMSDLTGPLLTTPNQTYDVSFAGAPKGTYKVYCLPHVALGMKLTIKVE